VGDDDGFAQLNTPYSQRTQWSGHEMKALGHVIGRLFMVTVFDSLASERISSIEALLWVKNLLYFHQMEHY